MEKEYVCVESDNKEMIGFVFLYDEERMKPIPTQRWETKTYRYLSNNEVYAERKDVTYCVTHGDEYAVLDSNGYPYYEGNFQYRGNSPEWIQGKNYRVCAEYHKDFESGDIVKLKSDKETRLEVVEKVVNGIILYNSWTAFGSREYYKYKLKGKDELYTVNEIQLAFKKDEFTFKRCVKSPRGKLVLNRIYRCHDVAGIWGIFNYRRIYYETGFNKTLSKEELKYDYKFVEATLEEYLEQYNAQFEPKQKRERVYNCSKRKEDGKVYRDNFADFINGKACVHINSESDMNWFRLALQQYGLEHKLGFTYRSFDVSPEYLAYSEGKVKFAYGIETVADYHMKVLEVTDLL